MASVSYLINPATDPPERMDQESHKWGFNGRGFFMHTFRALKAATPCIAAHPRTLMEHPPSQGADTPGLKKAFEEKQGRTEKAPAGDAAH